MRWRRGIQVLERRRGEVQIGTDPRWAVRVRGLARGEARMLAGLGDLVEVPLTRLAHEHDVEPARAQGLFDALARTRVLAPPVENRRGVDRDPVPARLGDDLQVRSLLLADADGAAQIAGRARRSVRIEGLGRVGTVLAGAPAAARVGPVVPGDPREAGPPGAASASRGWAGSEPGSPGRSRRPGSGRSSPSTRARSVRTRPASASPSVTSAGRAARRSPRSSRTAHRAP